MEDVLVVEVRDEVLWVTLNRPERLNAMNDEMVGALRELFQGLYTRRDVRVVVLRGAGRGFCAGLDLKEDSGFAERSLAGMLDGQRRIADIVMAMRRCPQPIVAAVQGPASGGGFALTLACDVRLASPEATFNASFIRVGLGGCDIGVSYFLPRLVGASVAAELLLSGSFLSAERGHTLGLVAKICAGDGLDDAVADYAATLLRATPLGLRLTKEALNHAIDAPGLEAVIALEDRNQILCVKDEHFGEGISAFREKRAPKFGGDTT